MEKESDFWPKMNSTSSQPEEIICNIVSTENEHSSNVKAVIRCEQFSSFDTLLRVTAWVLQFVNILKQRLRNTVAAKEDKPNTLHFDIAQAKILWYKHVQSDFDFNGTDWDTMKNLNVFMDETGVYHAGGKATKCTNSIQYETPSITPAEPPFFTLSSVEVSPSNNA